LFFFFLQGFLLERKPEEVATVIQVFTQMTSMDNRVHFVDGVCMGYMSELPKQPVPKSTCILCPCLLESQKPSTIYGYELNEAQEST
ncbi:hypothetical protein M8C21_009012, partial [Ambrosia artemisiifolia]